VFFESGDIIGLTHGGEVRWSRSLTREFGEFVSNHGLGGSLIQTDSTVLLQVDHTGPSYMLAVDKATGSNVWKTERPSRLSWTSCASQLIIRTDAIEISPPAV
jgi:outer membrane protein assembly factor BamB